MTPPLPRRTWLGGGAFALLDALLRVETAPAKSRPIHGGTLRSSLPLDLTEVDPHDPECLAATLLGPALFEPLFARTVEGRVYPTLASALPSPRGSEMIVTLRPRMRFSDGRIIDAAAARQSIVRSRRTALDGDALPEPRVLNARELAFRGLSPTALSTQLSQLSYALVPPGFQATSLSTSGALRRDRQRNGSLEMSHNALAPRGGSYVDRLIVESRPVAQALRDFETGASDLSLLGRGLHAPRRDSQSFELGETALVVLVTSESVRQGVRPGELQGLVDGLPRGPLEALGAFGLRSNRRKWFGSPTDLWVPRSDPWLLAMAEAIARAWNTERKPITVRTTTRQKWRELRSTKDFGMALSTLRMEAGPDALSNRLFELDDQLPPRSRLPSPRLAARQLHAAVVGVLRPRGGLANSWTEAIEDGRMVLSSTRRAAGSG